MTSIAVATVMGAPLVAWETRERTGRLELFVGDDESEGLSIVGGLNGVLSKQP
jgi:hypothetical protein